MSVTPLVKIPGIQYLRAFSVIAVLLFHQNIILKSGHIGVDIFFVISGFVITNQLTKYQELSPGELFKKFMKSRINRLLPALIFLLVISMVISNFIILFEEDANSANQSILSTWAFVHNYFAYLNTGDYFTNLNASDYLLPTWSLAVEMQIYLYYVIFFLAIRKLSKVHQIQFLTATALISLICWVSIPKLSATSLIGKPAAFTFYAPLTRFWEFAFGALALILFAGDNKFKFKKKSVLPLFLILLFACFFPAMYLEAGSLFMILVVLAAAYICAAFAKKNFQIRNKFVHNVSTQIGNASYTIYLSHFVVLYLLEFTDFADPILKYLYVGISLILGFAIHKVVELPFASGMHTRKVILFWAIIPILSQGMNLASNGILPKSFERVPKPIFAGDLTGSCYQNSSPECKSLRQLDVLLVGDSQAGSISEVVGSVSEKYSWTFKPHWQNGCPFVPVVIAEAISRQLNDNRDCSLFITETLDVLKKENPKMVIIANGAYRFQNLNQAEFIDFVETILVKSFPKTTFLIVENIPVIKKPLNFIFNRLNNTDNLILDKNRFHINSLEVKGWKHMMFLDTQSSICEEHFCFIKKQNKFVYMDEGHLSLFGAKLLWPSMEKHMSFILETNH